jgi:hypothetical protein
VLGCVDFAWSKIRRQQCIAAENIEWQITITSRP